MKFIKIVLILILSVAAGACSLKQLAVDSVIGALSGGGGGGNAFTDDDDPDLIGEALPFALKLYEILLSQSPENEGLLTTTGMGFVMYANAYVHTPSDMLTDDEYEKRQEMRQRAKRLYLRGRDYVLNALDIRYPGFTDALAVEEHESFLAEMKKEDVPLLYWASAGWVAAISIDSFDVEMGLTREAGLSLMLRALDIDESFGNGTLHEFMISYYGALPAMLGGSEEKARFHFQRALELSKGLKPGPYVSLATAVSVKNQGENENGLEEFRSLLEKALEIEDDNPETRLVTIITQRKARWLLDNVDSYFLVD